MAAAKTVNWLVVLPCVPLLAWLNYHFVEHSAAIVATGSMAEALELGIAQAVPGRQSWLAEGLALLGAWDAFKLWAISREGVYVRNPPYATLASRARTTKVSVSSISMRSASHASSGTAAHANSSAPRTALHCPVSQRLRHDSRRTTARMHTR